MPSSARCRSPINHRASGSEKRSWMYPRLPRAGGFPKGRAFPSLTAAKDSQPSPAGGRRSALAQADPPKRFFSLARARPVSLLARPKEKWGVHLPSHQYGCIHRRGVAIPVPWRGRQSRRFLETASLHPPLAALRRFPPSNGTHSPIPPAGAGIKTASAGWSPPSRQRPPGPSAARYGSWTACCSTWRTPRWRRTASPSAFPPCRWPPPRPGRGPW